MVILIVFSLVIELILTQQYNAVIKKNELLQKQAERTKVTAIDIIRNVHLLDLSLRGSALMSSTKMSAPLDSAFIRKEQIFSKLKTSLIQQGFPLNEFYVMKDSTDAYFDFGVRIRDLIMQGREKEYLALFSLDKGHSLFIHHREFSNKINAFANDIARAAKENHDNAQRNIYILQILVLCIVIPTLLYTAFFSNKTYFLSEQLRLSEEDKNKMLENQNDLLEHAVHERTNEILTQNEEIKAQNEEIVSHNEQLVMQQDQIEIQSSLLADRNRELEMIKRVVEEQNSLMLGKNVSLSSEVERQTHGLKLANKELMEQNTRLEQFAYIISHNLRAPIARLIGLTSILDVTTPAEVEEVHKMIQRSSKELDGIVKDLTGILAIQRLSPTLYSEIDLQTVIAKIKSILEKEISDTHATIDIELKWKYIISLSPYVESILLNLVSNAIKYRHPDRVPRILIRSAMEKDSVHLYIEDNGLGIDLNRHGNNIFNLYKRFHFHVEGKGLGLYLVRTQVEALGGKIEVKSEIERGTIFEVMIPSFVASV
jgi:signal transduction histidine kinase